jgi:methyl-accepting chemotaxis protein
MFTRKQIVINKKFQYSFIGVILLLVLLNTIAIIFNCYFVFTKLLEKTVSSQIAPEIILQMQTLLFKEHWFSMVLLLIVPLCIAAYISLYISHQIAGPAYHISKILKEWRKGNITSRISLRKNDSLKELATDINLTLNDMETRILDIKASAVSANYEKTKELLNYFNIVR